MNKDWWSTEATQHRDFKINLAIVLIQWVRISGLTQAQAADLLGITQPRVSNLMQGLLHRFSVDNLLELLGRAGYRYEQSLVLDGPPMLQLTIKPESK